MKHLYVFLLYFITLVFVCEKAQAQLTVDIDPSFTIGAGFNLPVNSLALQPDGKILIGGGFTQYNGVTRNHIVRLNADGSIDNSFETGTGFNNWVEKITVQSDGKILVGGGLFSEYNGQTQNSIARLNTDGSIDTSFDIGTGFNVSWGDSNVRAIALQSDGKILVGGNFTQCNGTAQNNIARLNTDGSLDTSFEIGTGFNDWVETITVQSDGKILVGGGFLQYNGQTRSRIIRLNTDGSIDTSFNIGTGFNIASVYHNVRAIVLQPDGKILVGGSFSQYNEQTQYNVARLNIDGSMDASFNSTERFYKNNATGLIYSIALQPDGKILVGGNFFYYNGQPQLRITRLQEVDCPNPPPTPQATLIPIPCSFIPEDIGTLVITYPLGDEYEYSIDGVNYQSSPVFPNVWAFSTLQITVRQETCISEPLTINIEDIEQNKTPIAEITQPDCSDVPENGEFGTLVVAFPIGDVFQYSIDGINYQDSTVFSNITSGNYQLTFRIHNSEFCASDPLDFIIYTSFIETPTVDIVQPNCDNPYGSIVVTTPFANAYEYSINGIDYQPSNVFENLSAGTYQVTVRKGNCISETLEVNINFSPQIPENLVLNVTQPTCENTFGSIEILSPVDDGGEFTPNYEYSINGEDYYEFTLFDNLSSGIYYVTVRHLMSGCVSESVEVMINEVPEIYINIVAICEDENRFILNAETQVQNYQYLWNTGETTSVIEINRIGVYSVVVSTENCSKEFSISIENIPCMIPKGISPNGDFLNDEFDLSGFGTINKVEIYNRYGKIVYAQSNYTNQWKGQDNNEKELPTGTYFYRIVFQNNKIKTGWVYLNK